MADTAEGRTKARDTGDTAAKLASLKEKVSGDVKAATELIDTEILAIRDWPPPEMVPLSIKKTLLSLGNRTVKLITALQKADSKMMQLDRDNRELRLKSPTVDSSVVAHLKMENQVLKERLEETEDASEQGKSLRDENVDLRMKLENLEAELNRLLIEAADAQEYKDENDLLRQEVDDLRTRLDADTKVSDDGTKPSGRLLASIWDMADAEKEAKENPVVAALQVEIGRLEADMARVQKRNNSLKEQNENLSSKVMELAEAAALRAESAMEEINSLREERNMLEQDRERYRGRLESLDEAREAEMEALRREVKELSGQVMDLETAQESYIENIRSIDDVIAETEEVRSEYEHLLSDFTDTTDDESREGRLKKAVVELISRCEHLEKMERDLAHEIDRLRGKRLESTDDLEKVIDALKAHIGDLEEELDEKDEELERLPKS
jgi:chromosome segregation ATPase